MFCSGVPQLHEFLTVKTPQRFAADSVGSKLNSVSTCIGLSQQSTGNWWILLCFGMNKLFFTSCAHNSSTATHRIAVKSSIYIQLTKPGSGGFHPSVWLAERGCFICWTALTWSCTYPSPHGMHLTTLTKETTRTASISDRNKSATTPLSRRRDDHQNRRPLQADKKGGEIRQANI